MPGSTPSVGSVVYSPSFTNLFPAPAMNGIGSQVAFGGSSPGPVYYHPAGQVNVTNLTNVNVTNSSPVNPGAPGGPGGGGSNPGAPGTPGASGTPATPGVPLDPGPNTAVPEPGTLGMGLIAAMVAAWLGQRKHSSGTSARR